MVTGFQMVCDGELAADDLFDCVLEVLRREHSPPWSSRSSTSPSSWPSAGRRATGSPSALGQLADVAATLADDPDLTTPGPADARAPRRPRDEHLARLDEAAGADVDLAWRVATRRAALGQYDEATVEALLERDPDPDAAVRALAVRTARPQHARPRTRPGRSCSRRRTCPAARCSGR